MNDLVIQLTQLGNKDNGYYGLVWHLGLASSEEGSSRQLRNSTVTTVYLGAIISSFLWRTPWCKLFPGTNSVD